MNVNEIVGYINENVPELSVEKKDSNYELDLEKDEVVILDNDKFVSSFRNVVVINEHLKEKDAIKEYANLANNEHSCAIFLKDKFIVVNNNGEIASKHNYSEILNNSEQNNKEKYTKADILNYLGNVSYTYYIGVYFATYFVILLIIFAFDILIVGILAFILSKILKIEMDVKKIAIMVIHALTLSAILYVIYLVLSYLKHFTFNYINIVSMIITYIYVVLYFLKKRKENIAEK